MTDETPTTLRVSDRWIEWIEETLPGLALGDQITYEVTFILAEVAPGQQAPAMLLTLFCPGVVLGTTSHTIAILPNPGGATKEGLTNILTGMVEQIRQERTRILSEMARGGNPMPDGPPNGMRLLGPQG